MFYKTAPVLPVTESADVGGSSGRTFDYYLRQYTYLGTSNWEDVETVASSPTTKLFFKRRFCTSLVREQIK